MRRQPQLLMGLWLAGIVVAVQPAWGSGNTPWSEGGNTSTNSQALLSQASAPQSPILVNGVRIDTTNQGIEATKACQYRWTDGSEGISKCR
ncbi:hypothetical protein H6G36_03835 [Anabaena minutissima FACHB-250]|nr:hypothetical protein [Anabaena minutissima FACHB-250]